MIRLYLHVLLLLSVARLRTGPPARVLSQTSSLNSLPKGTKRQLAFSNGLLDPTADQQPGSKRQKCKGTAASHSVQLSEEDKFGNTKGHSYDGKNDVESSIGDKELTTVNTSTKGAQNALCPLDQPMRRDGESCNEFARVEQARITLGAMFAGLFVQRMQLAELRMPQRLMLLKC